MEEAGGGLKRKEGSYTGVLEVVRGKGETFEVGKESVRELKTPDPNKTRLEGRSQLSVWSEGDIDDRPWAYRKSILGDRET